MTIPVKKDTAPPAIRKLAEDYIFANYERILDSQPCGVCAALDQSCGCPIPDEWVAALADEMMSAVIDTYLEWIRTFIAGRPYDTPLVEWEHRELDKRPQQAAEMRAEMTR